MSRADIIFVSNDISHWDDREVLHRIKRCFIVVRVGPVINEFLESLSFAVLRPMVHKFGGICLDVIKESRFEKATVPEADIITEFAVLVFVHGESWAWGSSHLYDARILATLGRIIVVTFNYRLGVFGRKS